MSEIIHGNNIEILKTFPDNSVDSIVTDPPYGLSFMNKHWDYDVPSVELWKECLRVLKPGGHLLSFAGTRTYHRMTVRIEDAGFEIRDMISYIYGQGFPKSLDIGKAIDKMQGVEREVIGKYKRPDGTERPNRENWGKLKGEWGDNSGFDPTKDNLTAPATPEAIKWNGWGTSLKPACEPICVARKPIPTTVAENVLKYGTGGINIDASRIGFQNENDYSESTGKNQHSKYKNSIVKNPANNGIYSPDLRPPEDYKPTGRFPANIIFDEISSVLLDEMSGGLHGAGNKDCIVKKYKSGKEGLYKSGHKAMDTNCYPDKGGASRFFMNIKKDIADDFLSCYLCANDIKKEICQEKNKPVQNIKKNLQNTEVTTEFTVQKNVTGSLNDKLVLLVSNAENLCDLCVMNFVQNLVLISENQKGVQSPEVLQAIQDFTSNYKNYTLLQNLVYCVEQMANIDTTPTTQNLLKLFGSVSRVIENYIKKDTREREALKSAPVRFQYVAKASKSERNGGLEGFEEKSWATTNKFTSDKRMEHEQNRLPNQNHHPTVKPLKLMQYLVRLVTPPKGICLDPFAGSGTTGMACEKEDFDYILCEREAEYIPIIKARIEWIKKQKKEIPEQTNLFKPL